MVEFIPLDLSKHKDQFVQLCFETLDWHFKQFKELYDFDIYPYTKRTSKQMAEDSKKGRITTARHFNHPP